ncbi:hypothetical protein ACHAQA_005186 [Verticillium albo-atrum]
MIMSTYSPAATISACRGITKRIVSTQAELDRLVKTLDPASYKLQRLLALSGSLAQFRDAVEQLQDALTSVSEEASQALQSALNVSVPPCSDASAIIEKQVQHLQPGFDVESLNIDLVSEYAKHHATNTRLFAALAALVQISPVEAQENRFMALQGRTLLDEAVESSARVLGQSDILLASFTPSEDELSSPLPPPEYEPDNGKGKQKATDGFFSSLSHSFKAMTASLRPKPEPIVIAMCESAKAGNIVHLKGFVAQGVNINGQDEAGYTALICATRANQIDAVQYLLSAGAEINVRDSHGGKRKPAVFHAAECGHVALAELLITTGADIRGSSPWSGQPFFIEIANSDKMDVLKLFLDHGADPNATSINGRSVFIHALQAGSLDHLRLLRQYGGNVNARDITGQPALHLALSQNRLDVVDFLLQHGADVNASNLSGNSMLHVAMSKRNLALARLLLDRGANPNATDYVGRSLLGRLVDASKKGDTFESELALLVLAKGADPNQCDSWGKPLLCHVMEKGNITLFRSFIERRANPNQAFPYQETPLLYAFDKGMLDHARLLLKHGADPNLANAQGRTPLMEALLLDQPDIVQELLAKGADINKAGIAKPSALAKVLANPDILQMLVAKGAPAPVRVPAPRPRDGQRPSGRGSSSSSQGTPVVTSPHVADAEEDELLPAYSPPDR